MKEKIITIVTISLLVSIPFYSFTYASSKEGDSLAEIYNSSESFTYLKEGIEYAMEENYAKAKDQIEKAIEIDKLNSDAKDVLRIIKDLDNGTINQKIASYLFKGERYLINEQFQLAISEFNQALKIDQNYPFTYVNLGV